MRIVHFADVHLDRPFVGLAPHAAKRRREDLFRAFERCLALARERVADLVTIGGDLWEEEHVRPDTLNSVAYELEQMGIPVLIVCGNHDPLLPGGGYLRTNWPDNVTIVSRGDSLHQHAFDDVVVWSLSWGGGDLSPRVLERLEPAGDDRTQILLIHGTSVSAPFASEADGYLPFDPRIVRESGFGVCLAGHIHIASYDDSVVYPGSPEPLGWGERGRHCAAVVEIGTAGVVVELVDINERRYETRELDCSGCASSAQIQDRLDGELVDADSENIFLRLRLVGEVDPDCEVELGRAVAAHSGRFAGLSIEDRTEPILDIDRRAERKGLDGLFVRKLREYVEEADSDEKRTRLEAALQAGLRALDGRQVILRVD